MQSQGRVRAFCRIPPNTLDASEDVRVVRGNTIEIKRSTLDGSKGREPSAPHYFTVDKVLDGTMQEDVYEVTTAPLVQSALLGVSATVMSCGHARSGRSYTLFGGRDYATRGVVHRALHTLFTGIAASSGVRRFGINISFVLLRGEELQDLLATGEEESVKPTVVMDGDGYPVWKGVTRRPCDTEEQALEALLTGLHAPQQGQGHRLFSISLEQYGVSEEDAETRSARLVFVDLIGPCKITGRGKEERLYVHAINRSLSSLEQVVLCLSKDNGSDEKGNHIPFRESKLTTILKGSIGGRCLTTVIAHLHPLHGDVESYLTTLQFVARIRRVPVTPFVNVVCSPEIKVRQLERQVAELQAELRLQHQLTSGDASASSLLSQDERAVLLGRIQSFLRGDSPGVKMGSVREIQPAFFYLKEEIEQRDATIEAQRAELQALREGLQQPVTQETKKGKKSASRAPKAVIYAPNELDESAGLSFGTAAKQTKKLSRPHTAGPVRPPLSTADLAPRGSMDSQPFSEEAASTVPSRKESDVSPPQPPAPARPNTASAALFPFRYFAAAEDVAHLPEEVAFERYKQSPAGAAQIRAIQRDQLKIKENEAEVHTLRQQLQAIRGEINAKSRGASPCGGVNVSSIDGTDSDVYEHMTSVQLAVQCRKSSDRLAQLVQGTQHLRRQLERRQATLLDNFTHWRRSSVEEVGTTIHRKVSTASPTPLLDGAEQVREASLGRVIQQDPAGAAFYTAHQRVTSRSRTSQRPASANFH